MASNVSQIVVALVNRVISDGAVHSLCINGHNHPLKLNSRVSHTKENMFMNLKSWSKCRILTTQINIYVLQKVIINKMKFK